MYSFSQIQVFAQCPRKYQYKYIDKIKEKEFESSPDLILWHAVHKALEDLYNQVNVFVLPSVEQVKEDFQRIRDEEIAEATREKPLQIKGEQTLDDYIRRGKMYLEAYYDKYQPFKDIKIIATEWMLSFDLDEKWVRKFRWIVDRIDKQGDSFIINDYKTNKHLPPDQKDEYTDQLTLYGLGIQQKYGKYFTDLKARLHYLHFDITDEREITQERLALVVKKYSDLIDQIEDRKFHYNMGNTKIFEPKQNDYCKYCEYMSICPLRAHMKYDDEVVGGELGEKTIKWLVDEYVTLCITETEAKWQKENIKEMLVDYLEKKWLLKLFGNTGKVSASQISNISIKDKDKLREILGKLWLLDEAMEIDRFKVQKFVKEGKLPIEKAEGSIEKKESRVLRPARPGGSGEM